jgi:hypothetical protein
MSWKTEQFSFWALFHLNPRSTGNFVLQFDPWIFEKSQIYPAHLLLSHSARKQGAAPPLVLAAAVCSPPTNCSAPPLEPHVLPMSTPPPLHRLRWRPAHPPRRRAMLRRWPAPWKHCPAAGSYPQPRRSSSSTPLPYPLPLQAINSPGQAFYRHYPPPRPPSAPPLAGRTWSVHLTLPFLKSSTPWPSPPLLEDSQPSCPSITSPERRQRRPPRRRATTPPRHLIHVSPRPIRASLRCA